LVAPGQSRIGRSFFARYCNQHLVGCSREVALILMAVHGLAGFGKVNGYSCRFRPHHRGPGAADKPNIQWHRSARQTMPSNTHRGSLGRAPARRNPLGDAKVDRGSIVANWGRLGPETDDDAENSLKHRSRLGAAEPQPRTINNPSYFVTDVIACAPGNPRLW